MTLRHFELHDFRRFADKAPFDIQQKFHALLDSYEASEEHSVKAEDYEDQLAKAREARATLEGLLPKPAPVLPRVARGAKPQPAPPGRLSDDAWAEYLNDNLPEERQATIATELERARAGETAALARVEALEEGIESAVEDLNAIDEPVEAPASTPAHEIRSSELFHCSCCQRASPNNLTRT